MLVIVVSDISYITTIPRMDFEDVNVDTPANQACWGASYRRATGLSRIFSLWFEFVSSPTMIVAGTL